MEGRTDEARHGAPGVLGIGRRERRYFIERAEPLGQLSGSPAPTRSKCGQSSGSDTADTHSIALQLMRECGGRLDWVWVGGIGSRWTAVEKVSDRG